MHDGTKVIRAGLPVATQGAPVLPGPTFAGTYHFSGEVAHATYTYGRYQNPTWTHFENAIGALEGGEAIVFASGMAAVAAVFGVFLDPGATLVMPSDGYYTARLVAEEHFATRGVALRQVPTVGDGYAAALDGATLLWLESPSNPGLDVCDIAALAAMARARGVLTAVDNTTATVLGQRPLALGADISVASDTKALTGHDDLVLGHVAALDPAHAARLRTWRTQFGAVPGPMETWLAHRSLATLNVRLEAGRHTRVAVGVSGLPYGVAVEVEAVFQTR